MTPSCSRRRLLGAAAAVSLLGVSGCATDDAGGDTGDPTEDGESPALDLDVDRVALEPLASGLELPLDVAFAPDADRRYVADQVGLVYVHESGGLLDEPFLDLRDAIVTGYEQGLLGIALHPDFANDRRVFVRYSAPPREGTPPGYSHTFVLAEFEATDDGSAVLPESERTVLEIPQPQSNHNAGAIAFGPDGYLYVPVGDGGRANDQGTGHVDDWYDAVPGGNGQDVTENLLGGVLRIDVDDEADGHPYAIPDDNPLVGREGLDEYYAWGLRNPWKLSFDGDDCFVADVGQGAYEEIDLLERGGNYGWNVKEGAHCFQTSDCPNETSPDVRGGEPLLDPIVEYPNARSGGDESLWGEAVIGGYVYRGSSVPALDGTYVFGDLQPNGRLFVARRPDDDGGRWPTGTLKIDGDDSIGQLLSFGRDEAGELYVLGDGSLHRVGPAA